ncbi:MAG: integrase zinc binding domain-containing protein [Bacteroidota bacterium]
MGHCGREKLLGALRAHHWWPGIYLDAADCVRHCQVC